MRALTTSLLLSSALLLAACSSTSLDKPTIEDRSGQGTPTTGREVPPVDVTGKGDMMLPPELASKSSIYFDYDSFVVRTDAQSVVEAHAKYLGAHKDRKVVIQGNTDERGGREYNLALGQKRAEAVRKSLSLLGVPESQMEAVSFGKEKPKAEAHDEASWAENRRADFVYPK